MFSQRLNIGVSASPGELDEETLLRLIEQMGAAPMPGVPESAMQPTVPMPEVPESGMQPTVEMPLTPSIGIRGRTFGSTPRFDFGPAGSALGQVSGAEASGRLGFNALLNDYRFGGGVRGNWNKGRLDFPDLAQQFGTPSKEKWGSRGIQLEGLDAYLQTPGGTRISVGGNPSGNNRRFSVRLNKKF